MLFIDLRLAERVSSRTDFAITTAISAFGSSSLQVTFFKR